MNEIRKILVAVDFSTIVNTDRNRAVWIVD